MNHSAASFWAPGQSWYGFKIQSPDENTPEWTDLAQRPARFAVGESVDVNETGWRRSEGDLLRQAGPTLLPGDSGHGPVRKWTPPKASLIAC